MWNSVGELLKGGYGYPVPHMSMSKYQCSLLLRAKSFLCIQEIDKACANFDRQWQDGTFPGWPKESSGALTHSGAYLDLSPFNSAEELKALGLDRLKSALMALGLKCGG